MELPVPWKAIKPYLKKYQDAWDKREMYKKQSDAMTALSEESISAALKLVYASLENMGWVDYKVFPFTSEGRVSGFHIRFTIKDNPYEQFEEVFLE